MTADEEAGNYGWWEKWDQAEGCVAGEFINLYPPGIPLIVPGEEFSQELCRYLQDCIDKGLNVQGITRRENSVFVKCIYNRCYE